MPQSQRPQSQRTGLLVATYAVAIFAGAFLVFQVQPIIGRAILPWFGGSPAVWTTCMLFFQTVLLLGYLYAHLLTLVPNVRLQATIHVALAIAGLASLPILPDASWKPTGGGNPTWPILVLLCVHVGLPYLLLSATGPLMQAWFSRSLPGRSPYRLYALSNVGSLLALLTYPVFVEPALTVREQTVVWSVGFCIFALIGGYLSARWWWPAAKGANAEPIGDGHAHDSPAGDATADGPPTWGRRLSWLLLPALASVMLLATTNHVCQDVAVIPFLWVAPLSLYLLSFILCFDSPWWYSRRYWGVLAMASIVGVSLMKEYRVTKYLLLEVAAYFLALLAISMICHGELVRRKPHAKYLTEFYLMCSAGGALGGFLVAIVCPLVFPTYVELHAGLILACAIAAKAVVGDERLRLRARKKWIATTGFLVLLVGFLAVLRIQAAAMQSGKMVAVRNFYGVLYVDNVIDDDEEDDVDNRGRRLTHGRISHGFQFTSPERRRIPTMYYDEDSGVGVAIRRMAALSGSESRSDDAHVGGKPANDAGDNGQPPAAGRPPLRVGVVGLGAGTIAVYAEPGDTYRIYEINPVVETLAREYFTYLEDCRGNVEVVIGDARRSMEVEEPQGYDVLALDAFSGDAIPAHLLTREAFLLYERHLAPGGVIAVHISNKYLDLTPIVANAAKEVGWQALDVDTDTNDNPGMASSQWVLLTTNEQFLADAVVKKAGTLLDLDTDVRMWTDEFSNLLPLLKNVLPRPEDLVPSWAK